MRGKVGGQGSGQCQQEDEVEVVEAEKVEAEVEGKAGGATDFPEPGIEGEEKEEEEEEEEEEEGKGVRLLCHAEYLAFVMGLQCREQAEGGHGEGLEGAIAMQSAANTLYRSPRDTTARGPPLPAVTSPAVPQAGREEGTPGDAGSRLQRGRFTVFSGTFGGDGFLVVRRKSPPGCFERLLAEDCWGEGVDCRPPTWSLIIQDRCRAGWQLGFILPCAGRRALGQTSSQHKLTSEGVESDCEITLGVTALLAEEYFQSRWGTVRGWLGSSCRPALAGAAAWKRQVGKSSLCEGLFPSGSLVIVNVVVHVGDVPILPGTRGSVPAHPGRRYLAPSTPCGRHVTPSR
ncbi:hypothetical protein O3P69_002044 [Scylla paramamosain]|uniref:Uncharacterized protein n=1 Tax=Scylla paramamosain TaxID=85552 RepID=A0AAW0V4A0_SCYPA